jgi:hypothetical protein
MCCLQSPGESEKRPLSRIHALRGTRAPAHRKAPLHSSGSAVGSLFLWLLSFGEANESNRGALPLSASKSSRRRRRHNYTNMTRQTLAALFTLILALTAAPPTHAALENQVKNNPSPYLAMHGNDPVRWQLWSAQTLERARKENKLLFVSVGYFSCYWCHVMQRESFLNADVARVLNEHFIPVKVDRELDPALDAQLLQFVARFRGSAGWPLNVFLTPDGYPLLGGVYFPQKEFLTVLTRLAAQWKEDHAQLSQIARAAAQETQQAAVTTAASLPPDAATTWPDALVRQSLDIADRLSGGFGEQSKFPMSAQLLALLEIQERRRDPDLGEFLRLTLQRMADLGLRDHLGGGFFRYTVDPTWHTPHFEKMLYDNALLARVYLRATTVLQAPEFDSVWRTTLDFVLERLRAPGGGYVSSLSAVDARGAEGAYYLWDENTLRQTLNDAELAIAREVWNFKGSPPFEGGYLPAQETTVEQAAKNLNVSSASALQHLEDARVKLRRARDRRSLPVDTKVIAAWNGLLLTALSEAAARPASDRYRVAAQQLRDHLVGVLMQDGVLLRVRAADNVQTPATIEDYAYVAAGLLSYARRFDGKSERELARKLVDGAWQRFHAEAGWQLGEASLLPAPPAAALIEDGALPSPTAVLLRVAFELAEEGKDEALRARAASALAQGQATVAAQVFNYASHVPLAGYVQKAAAR